MKEMKIIRAVLLCVSTMFLLVTTGCSRDNDVMSESSYQFMEKVKEISDIEGTIHSDSILSVHYSDSTFWYIKVADPNTQDSIRYDDMFGILKKQESKLSEGKKIIFSGTIWRWIDIESPSIHNTGFNIVVFSDVYFVE